MAPNPSPTSGSKYVPDPNPTMSTKITKLRCTLFNSLYSPEFAALGAIPESDFFVSQIPEEEPLTHLATHEFGPSHIPRYLSRAIPGSHTLRASFKTSSKPSDQHAHHIKYTILIKMEVLNRNKEPLRPIMDDICLEFWDHNGGDDMADKHNWQWFVLLLKLGLWEMFEEDGQVKVPSLRRPLHLIVDGGHGLWPAGD